jgi:mannosyltransferase OCH1-like enzyme
MIPKIIWQTYECEYKDLPSEALECANSWQHQNPNWEYKYVSAKERAQFVLNNFGEEWFSIYESYKANVLKADLWRYMCLYINGGIYSDIDIKCNDSIENFFNLDSDFVVSEDPLGPGYSQMIFASNPKNIFLENLLKDIKIKYYQKNVYSNIVDYETNEVGYIIFTQSLKNTSIIQDIDKDSFTIYNEDMAKKIHDISITHYRAGTNAKPFGKNYIAWQTEEYL